MFYDGKSWFPVQSFLSIIFVVASITYIQWHLTRYVFYRVGSVSKDEHTSSSTGILLASFTLSCSALHQHKSYLFTFLFRSFSSSSKLAYLSMKNAMGKRKIGRQYQRHRQRITKDWFTEYARNQRPLSTTWPWSIKPSLAVIWGVCWMFYGDEGSNANDIPQGMLEGNELYGIQEDYGWPYHGESARARPPPTQTATPNAVRRSQSDSGVHVTTPGPSFRQPQTGMQHLSGRERSHFRNVQSLARQYAPTAHHTVPSNTFAGGAAASYDVTLLPSHGPVPSAGVQQIINHDDPPYRPIHSSIFPSYVAPGLSQSHSQESSREAGRSHFAQLPRGDPQLTKTTAPHMTFSANPDYPHAREAQPSNLQAIFPYYSHFDPVATTGYIPNPTLPSSQVAASEGEGIVISDAVADDKSGFPLHPTPMVPPHKMSSPESEPSPPVSSYHRNMSPSIGALAVRTASEEDRSPGAEVTEQPKRFKRTESPRVNDHGKMTCKFVECAGVTFDRKCEWSKHMDKHDRPYKCTAPGCEKLLGFTYSGGLLRHEREVHKMHGGTKAPLFCPYAGCKRSSGDGFTRRENLSEHIRRVHQRTTVTPVNSGASGPRSGSGTTERGGRRSVSTTRLKHGEGNDDVRSPSVDSAQLRSGESVVKLKKRRREEADDGDEGGQEDDNDNDDDDGMIGHGGQSAGAPTYGHDTEGDLRGEVKRLKRELSMRDIRLQELQATVDRLSSTRDQPHDQQQRR